MEKRTRLVFGVVVSLLLLALPVVASCAPKEVEVPGKPASVGLASFVDMTGPARSVSYPAHVGIITAWKYLNEAEGGIAGVPINIVEVDTAYDVKKMRTGYEQYKDKVVTMTAPGQSGFYDALLERAIKDKMPFYINTGGADAFLYPPAGWAFGIVNTCDMFGFYGQWAMENWTEARKPRVAMLLGDYPGGRFPLFSPPYLEDLGMEVVATELLPFTGLTSAMDQLLRINAAEPDFIFTTIIVSQLVVVLEELRSLEIKLGSREMGGDFELFYCYGFGLDEMGMFRPENYDGIVVHQWDCDHRSYGDPDWPVYTKLVDKYMEYYNVPKERLAPGHAAFSTGLIMAEAVRQAVAEVGWENLTSEAVGLYGYPSVKDFETGVGFKATITPDDPRTGGSRLYRLYKDGSYEYLTEFSKPPWVFKWLDQHGFPIR